MGSQIVSLEPIRDSVQAFVTLMDLTFDTEDLRIGIYEGGFTNDQPWRLVVLVLGKMREQFITDPSQDILLKPQTFTDWIANGGDRTPQGYAADLFALTLEKFAKHAKDPRGFRRAATQALASHADEHSQVAPAVLGVLTPIDGGNQ